MSSGYWAVRVLPLGIGAAVGGLVKLRDQDSSERSSRTSALVQPGDCCSSSLWTRKRVEPAVAILKHYGAEVSPEAVDGKVAEELEARCIGRSPGGRNPQSCIRRLCTRILIRANDCRGDYGKAG